MSGIFVDSIKDASNTKTLATLSSSAVSLSSDVTVPASIGGSLVYLESTSGTDVASIAFENKFTSTDYIQYVIEFYFKPVTDDKHIVAQLGIGGGSTNYITSNYRTVITESYYGSSNNIHHRVEDTFAVLTTGVGNAGSDGGVVGTFYLIQPYVTGRKKLFRYNAQKWEQNDHMVNQTAGTTWTGGTDAITAIKFYAHASSNITGEMRMYGLKAS